MGWSWWMHRMGHHSSGMEVSSGIAATHPTVSLRPPAGGMVRYVRGMCLQSEDKTLPYIMQAYFSDLPLFPSREERLWKTKWKCHVQCSLHVQSDRTVLRKGWMYWNNPDKNSQESCKVDLSLPIDPELTDPSNTGRERPVHSLTRR